MGEKKLWYDTNKLILLLFATTPALSSKYKAAMIQRINCYSITIKP